MVIFEGKSPREMLTERLHIVIVQKIKCTYGFSLSGPPNTYDALLLKALENSWFTEEQLHKAVHEGICICGRASYKQHMQNPLVIRPDHVYSPEALGYAIKHGVVTAYEASHIVFDHGETVEDAIQWSKGFFEHVLKTIRTPRVRSSFSHITLVIDDNENVLERFVSSQKPTVKGSTGQHSGEHTCEGCPTCC